MICFYLPPQNFQQNLAEITKNKEIKNPNLNNQTATDDKQNHNKNIKVHYT